jgi:Cytochrome P460
MKRMSILALAAVTAAGVTASVPFAAGRADDESSPIFGVKIPAGYRQWKLVAVAHESELDELRGVLGNTIAMKAYQDGTLLYPDGTILASLGSTCPWPRFTEPLSPDRPRRFRS